MDLIAQIWQESGLYQITRGQVLMLAVCLLLLYLGIVRKFEPLLLVTIGFGGLLSNIPGAEIATLRGDLEKDHSESVVRLPPGYVLRNHTHTSDELYIWISGSFTLIAHDGTETKFRGPAYISFPGNAPRHEIKCGSAEPCLFYLRYSRPIDIKY